MRNMTTKHPPPFEVESVRIVVIRFEISLKNFSVAI